MPARGRLPRQAVSCMTIGKAFVPASQPIRAAQRVRDVDLRRSPVAASAGHPCAKNRNGSLPRTRQRIPCGEKRKQSRSESHAATEPRPRSLTLDGRSAATRRTPGRAARQFRYGDELRSPAETRGIRCAVEASNSPRATSDKRNLAPIRDGRRVCFLNGAPIPPTA